MNAIEILGILILSVMVMEAGFLIWLHLREHFKP